MTRTRDSAKSHLVIVLFGLCLAATSATSQEAQEAQETQEAQGAREAEGITGDARGGVTDREFPVPNQPRSKRPKGDAVELDTLLQLPSGFGSRSPTAVAGAGESEWRRRFTKAQQELVEARRSLDETKKELDEVAVGGSGSQWSIAPPGGGGGSSPSTSPMSFKLRQKLREDRERITEVERALRELRIEADLAGVPQAWRAVDPGSSGFPETRPELN